MPSEKKKAAPSPKIQAMLSLLEDSDPEVVAGLAENLQRMPESEFQAVIDAWCRNADDLKAPMPSAISLAQRRRAMEQFCRLTENRKPIELETGALLISMWGRPDLPLSRAQLKLDAYAGHLSETISRQTAGEQPVEAAASLCRYLFEEIGFRGNEENYSDPDNSFISAVLETRLGIPISLCLVALLVARRIGLDLIPIGSPNRFLIAVRGVQHLTYIDCFGGGNFLEDAQARRLLGKFPAKVEAFPPADTREILARMLRNLHPVYRELGDTMRNVELERMLSCVAI